MQPFPGPGRKWTVSTEGGSSPRWAQNGELFYVNGNRMMVVDVQTEPTFRAERPRPLFSISRSLLGFDVTPDGQRFLMVKLSELELPATQFTLVQNWDQELKRLVPAF